MTSKLEAKSLALQSMRDKPYTSVYEREVNFNWVKRCFLGCCHSQLSLIVIQDHLPKIMVF